MYRTGIVRFDAAFTAAHGHSGPRNVQTFKCPQHERLALPRRQSTDGDLQAVHGFAVLQLLIGRPTETVVEPAGDLHDQ